MTSITSQPSGARQSGANISFLFPHAFLLRAVSQILVDARSNRPLAGATLCDASLRREVVSALLADPPAPDAASVSVFAERLRDMDGDSAASRADVAYIASAVQLNWRNNGLYVATVFEDFETYSGMSVKAQRSHLRVKRGRYEEKRVRPEDTLGRCS